MEGRLDVEHRRATRRTVASDEPLAHAKLRTGAQLVVLEASKWGALVETTERLLPGRHLDVHIITSAGRILVRSRVVRAFVCRLQPGSIHYHCALAFEHPIDARACGHAPPPVVTASPSAPGAPHLSVNYSSDIVFDERLTA